jgi:DNA-binding MarR family transcriptional regulator
VERQTHTGNTTNAGLPAISGHAASVGFLISQIGFSSSRSLHDRLAPFHLEIRHFGLLRMVATVEGESQQTIAGLLQIPPSRLVALVDELEARGLVERRTNPVDRRAHALVLTNAGRQVLTSALAAVEAHEAELTEPLTAAERRRLVELLDRIAAHRGLLPGVHPGLRDPETVADPPHRGGPATGWTPHQRAGRRRRTGRAVPEDARR